MQACPWQPGLPIKINKIENYMGMDIMYNMDNYVTDNTCLANRDNIDVFWLFIR